jgi:hypothetical protein
MCPLERITISLTWFQSHLDGFERSGSKAIIFTTKRIHHGIQQKATFSFQKHYVQSVHKSVYELWATGRVERRERAEEKKRGKKLVRMLAIHF